MSNGSSPAPRPPASTRPGGKPHRSPPALVPLGLAAVLALLVWVALSQLHLQAAPRLATLFRPSPWLPLAPEQLGKLMALAGLAALAGGGMLLLLHLPHTRPDRLLTTRMAGLLGAGGTVYLALDMAPTLGLVPPGTSRVLVAMAEEAVQWSALGGAAWLLTWRWLAPSGKGEPPGKPSDEKTGRWTTPMAATPQEAP